MRSIVLFFTLFLTLFFTAGPTYAALGTPYPVPSGSMIVGDAKAKGQNVTLSGDVTVSNAGVTTIGANAIDSDSYVDGSIDEEHIQAAGTVGRGLKRVVRVSLDCAVLSCVPGTIFLNANLPANTMITRSYIYIKTQFVGATGTVAIQCEDANNIKTATDITGTADGGFIEGQSTGAASAFVAGIAAECNVNAVIATAEQTAGTLVAFIEYVVVE